MNNALITGISGQDGAHLTELLLNKGYKIFGIDTQPDMWRLRELGLDDEVEIVSADITDLSSLIKSLKHSRADEVYHLASQSFVGSSFEHPIAAGLVTGLGTLNVLEAVKIARSSCKVYNAATSELYGDNAPEPQDEDTPMRPSSPYAVAKLYAYNIVRLYREAYDLFCCSGILFNHESCTGQTPVMTRRNGQVDIQHIEDVVPHPNDFNGTKVYTTPCNDLEVWDKNRWSRVTVLTATWRVGVRVVYIFARGGCYEVTEDHTSFKQGSVETPTEKLQREDMLELGTFPEYVSADGNVDSLEALFMGMMVADGSVSIQEKNPHGRFVNNNTNLRNTIAELWHHVSGGYTKEHSQLGGFGLPTSHLSLQGNSEYLCHLNTEMYTSSRHKKVPMCILNASRETAEAFLDGYYTCDGLKAPNVNLDPESNEYTAFGTNSPALAHGLWFLFSKVLGRRLTLHPEFKKPHSLSQNIQYHVNINASSSTSKGPRRPLEEVKDIRTREHVGWLYDLATESGTFSAGIGLTWIHNSEFRGEEFVTRKISLGAAKIRYGLADKVVLGNLDAKRDWGYSKEYVEAMWLMLHNPAGARDYVCATGETHSVKEFCKEAFGSLGLDWETHVEQDTKFLRPRDIGLLRGNPARLRVELDWMPKTGFRALVKLMVEADIERVASTTRRDKTRKEVLV